MALESRIFFPLPTSTAAQLDWYVIPPVHLDYSLCFFFLLELLTDGSYGKLAIMSEHLFALIRYLFSSETASSLNSHASNSRRHSKASRRRLLPDTMGRR
jgi:hypothetical protein